MGVVTKNVSEEKKTGVTRSQDVCAVAARPENCQRVLRRKRHRYAGELRIASASRMHVVVLRLPWAQGSHVV